MNCKYIANKYSLNYVNLGTFHVLSKRKLPTYAKYVLKFSKFGLHKILQKRLKSKTWEDYLKMSEK